MKSIMTREETSKFLLYVHSTTRDFEYAAKNPTKLPYSETKSYAMNSKFDDMVKQCDKYITEIIQTMISKSASEKFTEE